MISYLFIQSFLPVYTGQSRREPVWPDRVWRTSPWAEGSGSRRFPASWICDDYPLRVRWSRDLSKVIANPQTGCWRLPYPLQYLRKNLRARSPITRRLDSPFA